MSYPFSLSFTILIHVDTKNRSNLFSKGRVELIKPNMFQLEIIGSFQKIGVDEISSKFIHRLKGDRDLCFQIGIILCVFFDTRNLIGNYSSDNLSIDRIFMKFMLHIYIYIYIVSTRN